MMSFIDKNLVLKDVVVQAPSSMVYGWMIGPTPTATRAKKKPHVESWVRTCDDEFGLSAWHLNIRKYDRITS